jgi:hypothetical protein
VVAEGGGMLARSLMGKPVACVADKQGLWAEYAVTKAARCIAMPGGHAAWPGCDEFRQPADGDRAGQHGAPARRTLGGDLDRRGGALGRMIEARGRQKG